MTGTEKGSYIDRYGRRYSTELELSPGDVLSFQQAGLFARRVDISHNGTLLKRMGFTAPMGSFATEIDGRSVTVKQRTVHVGGWKRARFTVEIDGEQALEFHLSKQGQMY